MKRPLWPWLVYLTWTACVLSALADNGRADAHRNGIAEIDVRERAVDEIRVDPLERVGL